MRRAAICSVTLGLFAFAAAWALLPRVPEFLLRVEGHLVHAHGAALSADGQWAATSCAPLPSNDGEWQCGPVVVWDLAQERAAWSRFGPKDRIATLRFSPDGRLLAIAAGPLLHLVDARTGANLREFAIDEVGKRAFQGPVVFSPDSAHLAFPEYTTDGEYDHRDLAVFRLADGVRVVNQRYAMLPAFAPDGKTFACFLQGHQAFGSPEEGESAGRGVYLFDLGDGRSRRCVASAELFDGFYLDGRLDSGTLLFPDSGTVTLHANFVGPFRGNQISANVLATWAIHEPEAPRVAVHLGRWAVPRARLVLVGGKCWMRVGDALVLRDAVSGARVGEVPLALDLPKTEDLRALELYEGGRWLRVVGFDLARPMWEQWLGKIGLSFQDKDRSAYKCVILDPISATVVARIPNVHKLSTGAGGDRLLLSRGWRQGHPGASPYVEVWSIPPRRNWPTIAGMGLGSAILVFAALLFFSSRRLQPARSRADTAG